MELQRVFVEFCLPNETSSLQAFSAESNIPRTSMRSLGVWLNDGETLFRYAGNIHDALVLIQGETADKAYSINYANASIDETLLTIVQTRSIFTEEGDLYVDPTAWTARVMVQKGLEFYARLFKNDPKPDSIGYYYLPGRRHMFEKKPSDDFEV